MNRKQKKIVHQWLLVAAAGAVALSARDFLAEHALIIRLALGPIILLGMFGNAIKSASSGYSNEPDTAGVLTEYFENSSVKIYYLFVYFLIALLLWSTLSGRFNPMEDIGIGFVFFCFLVVSAPFIVVSQRNRYVSAGYED